VEIDTTLLPLVGSGSVKTSPNVTPDGDHITSFDVEQIEDIDEIIKLFAIIGTKINPRKW